MYHSFKGIASFAPCTSVILVGWSYCDPFQGAIRHAVMKVAAYNITWLDLSVNELIVPIVDCSPGSVIYGDEASVRVYDTTHMEEHHDGTCIIAVIMLIQKVHDYSAERARCGQCGHRHIYQRPAREGRGPQLRARPRAPVPKSALEVYSV